MNTLLDHKAWRMSALALGLLGAVSAPWTLAAEPGNTNHVAGHAPQGAQVKWTPASLRVALSEMPAGDAGKGKALHNDMFCASCHGVAGEALTPNWPSLAGQRAEYTYKMLLDYHSGLRREDVRADLMTTVAALLSKQDMADLAAFYAAQPLPAASHTADAATSGLIRRGEPSRLVTPCASCHGLHGQGGINETPALAGSPRDYFIRTMQGFRSGVRHNDALQAMRAFAKPLTDDEIFALADYYAPAAQ
ncbi:MAG: c-type cytochrome [Pseudomonadota bacterium]